VWPTYIGHFCPIWKEGPRIPTWTEVYKNDLWIWKVIWFLCALLRATSFPVCSVYIYIYTYTFRLYIHICIYVVIWFLCAVLRAWFPVCSVYIYIDTYTYIYICIHAYIYIYIYSHILCVAWSILCVFGFVFAAKGGSAAYSRRDVCCNFVSGARDDRKIPTSE